MSLFFDPILRSDLNWNIPERTRIGKIPRTTNANFQLPENAKPSASAKALITLHFVINVSAVVPFNFNIQGRKKKERKKVKRMERI